MNDGSITISTKLDNAGLERDLSKLKKEIAKLEQSTSSSETKKAPLVQQAGDLEVKMKSARAEVERYRAAWAAGVAGADKDQSMAISKAQQLEAEHGKVVAQIDKIDAKLQPAYQKMDAMKDSAGGLEKKLAEAASKSNLMGPAMANAEKHMDRFASRVKVLARRVFVFAFITAALRAIRTWMGKVVKTNSEATAAVARLKGALLTMAQPLVEVVIPAFTAFVNILADAISALANIISIVLGSTVQASAEAAEGLYGETEAIEGVGGAAKKAGKQLAAFDEINKLSDGSESGSGGSSNAVAPDFSTFDSGKYKQKIDEITAYISGALLALGVILTFSGANIPLGIGLMAVGAIGLVAVAKENWGAMSDQLREALTTVLVIVGGFLLAIGLILALSGVSVGKGLALMAIGAAALAGSVAVNWSNMNVEVKKVLVGLLEIAGGFLLAIGLMLALTGANIPLGIGLILAGAAMLAASAFIQWKLMGREIKAVLTEILLIAGGVLAAVGLVLIATGHIPLGVGMLVAGAAALGTAAALNWGAIVAAVQGQIGKIMAAVSAAILVLGIILAATGVALPLGIALIAAGAAGLVTVGALNWDAILNKLKEVWSNIKSWWNTSVSKYFTLEYWAGLGGNIVTGLLNGLESIGSSIVEWGSGILNDIKDVLGIHSPSTETESVGEYIVQGLVNGLDGDSDTLQAGVQALKDILIGGAKDAANTCLETQSGAQTAAARSVQTWQSTIKDFFAQFYAGLISQTTSWASNLQNTLDRMVSAAWEAAASISSAMSGSKSSSSSGVSAKSSALRTVSAANYKIPALATGAVIPPNREFMAVLGDQKRGANIEAPLETMVQAFKQAAREIVGAGNGNTTIIMELDGQQFGKVVYKANKAESRRVGVSLSGV